MTERQLSEIVAGLPPRISEIIKPWAERSPDRAALVEDSGTWTYRQLGSVVAETRVWLRDSGVRPGDRVMVVCENCRALVAVVLALAGLDAWPVLVNARLSGREIEIIRDHCDARRVIYTTGVSPHASEHARRHGAVVAEPAGLGSIGLSPLYQEVEPEPLDREESSRVAALIYTSGTTGLPKGVMLTHRNVLFIAAVSARIRSLTPEDRLYGILPLSHVVGFSVVLLGTLLSGGTLYLSPRFDPMTARMTLEKHGLTVVLGAPAMFALFLEFAKLKGITSLKLPSLRIISASGAPLQPALKTAVEKLFGLVLHNGYGITECSPTIAQTRVDAPRNDISVGPVFPGIQVKIVGPDHRPVDRGEVGELWVRGPNVMKGYYRAPEETASAINKEGWFNTRDLARLDDGNLFIVGRTKELIVRRGFNIYPAEVEAVLNTHPAVARSAVIGRVMEDGAEGEEILAFVQPVEGALLTTTELAEHASRHLAPYKRPSQILFIPSMPVTPTGKIMKAELAKMIAEANPALRNRLTALPAP
jgi:acyl-CoA synthetase (AMP-forming)/AMP-acid ligase II